MSTDGRRGMAPSWPRRGSIQRLHPLLAEIESCSKNPAPKDPISRGMKDNGPPSPTKSWGGRTLPPTDQQCSLPRADCWRIITLHCLTSEVNDYWILVSSASMYQVLRVSFIVSPHDKATVNAVRNLIHKVLCLILSSIGF